MHSNTAHPNHSPPSPITEKSRERLRKKLELNPLHAGVGLKLIFTETGLANRRLLVMLLLMRLCWGGSAGAADYLFQPNVMIPMRDGVQLAANIFLPENAGAVPCLLMRTPYGKGDKSLHVGTQFASRGYAVLVQDCRGRGDSQGIWDPFVYDPKDGFDTQEWIGARDWSNGKIGTFGGSYGGWTQWASAPERSRFLTVMFSVVPFCDVYEFAYPGGALQLALLMGWGSGVGGIRLQPSGLQHALRYLPLAKWDSQFDKTVGYLRDWVAHTTYDEYWQQRGIQGRFEDIEIPVLNIGGWYDIFSKATLEMTERVRRQSNNRYARRNQFVILGPWSHGVGSRRIGQLDFGEAAKLDIPQIRRDWFDYWLQGSETGVEDWPAYKIFVMGENRWRAEHEWPLKRTQYTKFYLHSLGNANSRSGDGMLARKIPEAESTDQFVYDPTNPVPTLGGNNLMGAPAGPFDQSEIETRPDVLVYTTAPLQHELEVTGQVRMVLYAASTASDTDFTAKLLDVHPDAKAYSIRSQPNRSGRGLRARFTPETAFQVAGF